MTTNPTPPADRSRDSAAEHAAAEESRATPGGFCHTHWSWLCGRGQGKCQHPARGEASTRLAEIRAAVTREATTLGPIADDMAWLLDRGDAAEKLAEELEQWRQDLYTALGVSRALTPQEVAAQVRKALVDLGAAEAERNRLAAQIATVRVLHRPIRIYGECGHDHDPDGADVQYIAEVGYVCDAGYLYTICAECCTDREERTEPCVDYHEHQGRSQPCLTLATLDTTQDGDRDA